MKIMVETTETGIINCYTDYECSDLAEIPAVLVELMFRVDELKKIYKKASEARLK